MAEAIPPAATEPQTPETKTETPPAEPKAPEAKSPPVAKEPSVAARFAIAAKREKEARRQQEAIRAERAEIERMRKEIEAERAQVSGYKQDPLSAIKAAGINLDSSTQTLLASILQNQGNSPEAQIQALAQKLDAFQRQAKEAEQARQAQTAQAAKAEEERQAAGYRAELANFAKAAPDAYEYSAAFDPDGALAFATAKRLYDQSAEAGEAKVPSHKEVLDRVEAYLEERFAKVASLKKFGAKFGPQLAPKPPSPEAKTLSTTMNGGTPMNGTAPKNEAERIARALAAMEAIERAKAAS